MASHITKAKTHVFKNDDLKQVLHVEEGAAQKAFTKTKRESSGALGAPLVSHRALHPQCASHGGLLHRPRRPVSAR